MGVPLSTRIARTPAATAALTVSGTLRPDAAHWLALPRTWGLTVPAGAVGGAHAGYRVYPCADGRVAVAALEPHFAARLCDAAGMPPADMADAATHRAIALAELIDTPILIVHGDRDPMVGPDMARELVAAIRPASAAPRPSVGSGFRRMSL